ncbi:Zinc finger protein-like 1 [Plakobranchus ocellatus]|uniref:Zinc finger protein-like 1 n=1 Tax=Plakobranchus ocellatus TaxID=259542 RepID=A0AAV3ZRE9_9GAST|nr:Zinc finger protein-like 1 [Plakobranchus ocellatus]
MGLCKCPKRKVTNLFCFEHRVNVCENCLVANHSKCIVKSYLQWLQDSDYSPLCTLCQQNLNNEEFGECVRLTCYDVFHWNCLNQYAQQLPPQTAPAGYVCPLCSTCIFPQSNLVSPVADALRAFLQQVNWARAGLGLPLIEETQTVSLSASSKSSASPVQQANGDALEVSPVSSLRQDASLGSTPGVGASPGSPSNSSSVSGQVGIRPSAQVAPYSASPPLNNGGARVGGQHSVISVDEGTSARGFFSNPRKLFDTTKEDDFFGSHIKSHDHDEDKYKRRPALQWLARWFNSRDGTKRKDPQAVRKRFAVVLMLGVIGFITIIIIFAKLGRQSTEDDPFFDPLANPNIKVQQNVDSVP